MVLVSNIAAAPLAFVSLSEINPAFPGQEYAGNDDGLVDDDSADLGSKDDDLDDDLVDEDDLDEDVDLDNEHEPLTTSDDE